MPENDKSTESFFQRLLHLFKSQFPSYPLISSLADSESDALARRNLEKAREGVRLLEQQMTLEVDQRESLVIGTALSALATYMVNNQSPAVVYHYWRMVQDKKELLVGEAYTFEETVKDLCNVYFTKAKNEFSWEVVGSVGEVTLNFKLLDNRLVIMQSSNKNNLLQSDNAWQAHLHRAGILCCPECESVHKRLLWKRS